MHGSNLLDYKSNTKALTADLVTMKLLLNSVLSILCVKFITIDVKNFYLEIELKEKQHIVLPLEITPEEIKTNMSLKQ